MNLKRRYAVGGAGRRANFGGEIGKRRQRVAGKGRFLRKLTTQHLHAVAGVTCEAHDNGVEVRLGYGRARRPVLATFVGLKIHRLSYSPAAHGAPCDRVPKLNLRPPY